ncbi:MAG TPA: hypothetical protein VJ866_00890 [Pyrinomonadaceae bacterium]|nr:hypothetical protein [Pyrinomonadaceae bacterium]
MLRRVGLLAAAACVAALCGAEAAGQTAGRAHAQAATQAQAPSVVTSNAQAQEPSAAAAPDALTNEVALLRKAVVSLSARLREVSEKFFEADAAGALGTEGGASERSAGGNARGGANASAPGRQSPLAQSLNILTLAEQRAEVMRRQLLEMIEKETVYRNRLVQLDEDMRPENIDRNLTLVGTTRSTTDLRDTRRRVLDNERKGVENLLNQTSASRSRLEEDLRQADLMVSRIRQKLLPLIDREIDKLAPNP